MAIKDCTSNAPNNSKQNKIVFLKNNCKEKNLSNRNKTLSQPERNDLFENIS